jgi:hypothetical protein
MRVFTGLLTCLLGFSGVAQAARLSSPAIFGAHTQRHAICTVFNNGTEPLDVVVTILGESGEKLRTEPIEGLLPGEIVPVFQFINLRFGVAHACTVDAASVANLRASLTIIELALVDGRGVDRPFRSVPLR